MNVLSLCDRTGIMVKPWAEAGHDCLTVDLQESSHDHKNISHSNWDVRKFLEVFYGLGGAPQGPKILDPWKPDIVFAFPPCTDLAGSGARWFAEKGLGKLIGALQIVHACHEICKLSDMPWMLENPVGTLSTYMGKPDFMFHPYEYGGYVNGDRYTKKTCIWAGGGFVMPLKRPLEPTEGLKMHRLPPGKERANLRSMTPEGFAMAVFEANEPMLRKRAA